MKYTQKPVSIFPNNVLLQSHEISHSVAISHEYPTFEYMCFKRRHSVPIVFLTRCRIRHVIFTCSLHPDNHFHVTISYWLLSVHSVLSVCHINKSLVMKMNYVLPRAKLLPVTFFMKWSYLLPLKTLNCHISRTRHTRIPVFALNWDLVTSIL